MSLFLGKIHYWLFAKIQWFEGLEQEVLNFAKSKSLPVEGWTKEVYGKYGYPTEDRPLEEIIDTGNIHGWLQNRIVLAEERSADFITKILNVNSEYINDLIKIYREQGIKAAIEYKAEKGAPSNAVQMYEAMNDYILEGMPCDRINEILVKDENRIQWIATECIHYSYWENKGGDVKNFYKLRDNWINSFIKELDENYNYNYNVEDTNVREIVRVEE